MASTVSAAAVVPGPSHETSLPRRPPCHWLRPPRESVVNALLPWHARTSGRLDSARRSGRGEPPRSTIETGPSERKQKLLETDHLTAQGRIANIHHDSGTNSPLRLRADRPECGESTALRRPASGELGNLPSLGSRGRRFGSDILWQTGRNRSTRSMGRRTGLATPSPMRLRSHRLSRPHARSARGRSRADRAGDRAVSLRLVSHHETT